MKHQVLLIGFLQVYLVRALREVSGYVGDTVILSSGADPSWSLSKVEWSVFSNNTWIATYHKGKQSIEWFYQYKGRLSLSTSGDLTIHNLNPNDAMEYSVDLISTEGIDSVNKIKLVVRQRLQKPTIDQTAFASLTGRCWVELHCSSSDEGVHFTWQVKPPSVTVFKQSDPAFLLANLNTTQDHVEFTCTSSKNTEKASSVITSKCDGEKSQPTPQPQPQPTPQPPLQSRSSYAVVFVIGFILGSLAAILIYSREQIKAALKSLKEKRSPSTNSA